MVEQEKMAQQWLILFQWLSG